MRVCVCVQEAEALDAGSRRFEELEFCQLEQESSLEERKEARCSQLLQEKAECHRSLSRRKVTRPGPLALQPSPRAVAAGTF